MLASGPLLCSLLTALQVTAVTAGGDGGLKTRVRGIDLAAEGCIGAPVLASLGTYPGIGYSYDETVVDPSRQYNGRVYDPSTGFHDYGARMYWPEIGRFVSADTYGGSIENPASLNRYAYVQNNPYKYVDPSGRDPVESRIFEKPISYDNLVRAGLADKVSTEYIVNHGLDREAAASVGVSLQGMTQSEQNDLSVAAAGVGVVGFLAGAALSTVDPYAGTATRTGEAVTAGGPKVGSAGGPGAGKRFSATTQDTAEAEAGGRCVFCGRETTRTPGGTQRNTDHAIPKSRDGNNTLGNAQNTCRDCNLGKGTQTTQEYLERRQGGGG